MGNGVVIASATGKKPWASPQVIEIEIKMTENGGGIGIDIAGEEIDLSS